MTNLDEPRKEAYRSFLVAHARLTEAMDKYMTDAGLLPLGSYDVLVTLEYAEDRRLRMSELADRILLSKSGLTRLFDRLVEKGYVARKTCSSDRRVVYAELTDAGKRAREASWPMYSRLIEQLFGSQMSDEEAATVRAVMCRAAEAVLQLKISNCLEGFESTIIG